jgi:hypothetical protein
VAALNITNARNRTLLNITPNAFPATRYGARRDLGDDSVIEYIQVLARVYHAPESIDTLYRTPKQLRRMTGLHPFSYGYPTTRS